MIAEQIISRLEYLHNRNFIHRDIKPENFLVGLGKKSNIIHLLDFGLTKRYRDAKTGEHIPAKERGDFVGTAKYASVNSHLGREQSRRDDLESVGFMMIYFLKGSLPWDDGKKDGRVGASVDQLTNGLPKELNIFMKYCRGLEFDSKPDYSYLRSIFKDAVEKKGQ